jgi:hypothetical protein
MNERFVEVIKQATGASSIKLAEVIQELWSGYGSINRYELTGTDRKQVIAKHIQFPNDTNHPRGWNTNLSHERKLKSYQVEQAWYKNWAHLCGEACKVPDCLAIEKIEDEILIVLEDLQESGYTECLDYISKLELKSCLSWLANFHATFMQHKPTGLWAQGTYWHLATRPDELEALDDKRLKQSACSIDQALRYSPFQTIVHGDAKIANFCFTPSGKKVAAVDFQYVGGGCGMKDVAYFLGSCLTEKECEQQEEWILDFYFAELTKAIKVEKPHINTDELETDWRKMYPVAVADFHRFLKGWSPGHWKLNSYSEKITRKVIAQLLKSD